jgi:hypothetical protein
MEQVVAAWELKRSGGSRGGGIILTGKGGKAGYDTSVDKFPEFSKRLSAQELTAKLAAELEKSPAARDPKLPLEAARLLADRTWGYEVYTGSEFKRAPALNEPLDTQVKVTSISPRAERTRLKNALDRLRQQEWDEKIAPQVAQLAEEIKDQIAGAWQFFPRRPKVAYEPGEYDWLPVLGHLREGLHHLQNEDYGAALLSGLGALGDAWLLKDLVARMAGSLGRLVNPVVEGLPARTLAECSEAAAQARVPSGAPAGPLGPYAPAARGVPPVQAVPRAGAAAAAEATAAGGRFIGETLPIVGTSCFVAGTPLLTPDGDKPIERFQVGDWVLSRSEHDPEEPLEARRVEAVFVRVAPLFELRVGGRVIRTTVEHPFYVHGLGWRTARELKPGDRLCSHDGQCVPVEAVTDLGEVATVYNLRVAEYHTYFVGSREWGFSVWAHNAECAILFQHGDRWVLQGRVSGRVLAEGAEADVRAFARLHGHDVTVPLPGEPLSPQHRAAAWQEYQNSFRPGGSREGRTPLSQQHWDNLYNGNMTRPTVANQPVIDYHARLGWGRRQVTVETPPELGPPRKLDIADVAGRRGVEVKTGYQRMSPEISSEIERDAWLIRERGWDIEYHFAPGSRASQGFLDAASRAGIRVTGL